VFLFDSISLKTFKMEVFRGRLVLLEDGLSPATILTKEGKIVKVLKGLEIPNG
jgi:hypothetical protein